MAQLYLKNCSRVTFVAFEMVEMNFGVLDLSRYDGTFVGRFCLEDIDQIAICQSGDLENPTFLYMTNEPKKTKRGRKNGTATVA